jgi:hypothetical protein
MSIARDISRQTRRFVVDVTSGNAGTNYTISGGFSGSSLDVYLNGSKLIINDDYSLNGTTGVILNQTAVAGDVIEFVLRNVSSVINVVDTSALVDEAVTFGKLSNSATEADNVQKRTAKAWVNFNGTGTVTIRADFNVDTITDYGVGSYGINFTVPMTDTGYVTVVTGSGPVNATAPAHHCLPFNNALVERTVSQSTVAWFKVVNAADRADPDWAEAVIFR